MEPLKPKELTDYLKSKVKAIVRDAKNLGDDDVDRIVSDIAEQVDMYADDRFDDYYYNCQVRQQVRKRKRELHNIEEHLNSHSRWVVKYDGVEDVSVVSDEKLEGNLHWCNYEPPEKKFRDDKYQELQDLTVNLPEMNSDEMEKYYSTYTIDSNKAESLVNGTVKDLVKYIEKNAKGDKEFVDLMNKVKDMNILHDGVDIDSIIGLINISRNFHKKVVHENCKKVLESARRAEDNGDREIIEKITQYIDSQLESD